MYSPQASDTATLHTSVLQALACCNVDKALTIVVPFPARPRVSSIVWHASAVPVRRVSHFPLLCLRSQLHGRAPAESGKQQVRLYIYIYIYNINMLQKLIQDCSQLDAAGKTMPITLASSGGKEPQADGHEVLHNPLHTFLRPLSLQHASVSPGR